jgi:cyclopropane fatty-acyl-phospholipid synthase-like methyltransferase
MAVKDLVRPLPGVRQISLLRQRINFKNSVAFWEQNYARGDTSGNGSYGAAADAKAKFLNEFVRNHGLQSVVEFGCGDGNQLSLADYPSYVGLDVSKTAVRLCQMRFADDLSKSFFLYDGACFTDHAGLFTADLAVSLDVIYHLIEDPVFETYMTHLFAAGQLFVVVYATNMIMTGTAPHVKHRRFTSWVEDNCPQWMLTGTTRGPNSGSGRADFFVYEKVT